MPVGTVVLGEDAILHAGTSSGAVTTPISDISSYSRPTNRPVTKRAVFMNAVPHSFPGARDVTLTLNGLLSMGDSGQDILRDAEEDGTVAYAKLLPDGTNGKTAGYRVGSRGLNANADGPTECSFDLALETAEVDVGTGKI